MVQGNVCIKKETVSGHQYQKTGEKLGFDCGEEMQCLQEE